MKRGLLSMKNEELNLMMENEPMTALILFKKVLE